MNETENNHRAETRKQLDSLYEKLSRLPVNEQYHETKAEIKKLTEVYITLPVEKINSGNIYLSKKTVYEGPRFSLKEFNGKLWLYDELQCLTDKIEFDVRGEPARAEVFVRHSYAPDGEVHVYNLLIDQPVPKKPRGKPFKAKFKPDWTCLSCGIPNQVMVSGTGKERTTCEFCRVDRSTGKTVDFHDL